MLETTNRTVIILNLVILISFLFEKYITPENCPLCGNNNYCGNLSSSDNKACWCRDNKVQFPGSLLSQVSDADKNKACICKTCALSHNSDLYKSI